MNQLLLIIDAQQELIEGNKEEQPVYRKGQLVETINLVIGKALGSDIPVVFVRDTDVGQGEGKGFQIHEGIRVPENSIIFDKSATNSFHGTGLLNHLQSLEIQHVAIMGCATQHCIDTAVRTATINGLDVTLVADGHSTPDSKSLSAAQIIQHHNETLHGHYNVENISIVRKSDEELFQPTHNSYRE